ncbi:MAG: tryptophan synthase subunit alpha [Thermodesulfobacteriota bacterium]|jgi:tryptophan synthase alpha chain|nr:MAG: tryptophan synthase subunit alpha [Thermodesulfobacteriota bacterium]
MSRIKAVFQNLKAENKKALIAYITIGDPHISVSKNIIRQLIESGADILELGVPFSDPTADGPVIQSAAQRALKTGVTLDDIMELVKEIRQFSQIPLILFSYYNPLFVVGAQEIARRAKEAGVDGLLVVDLPYEEAEELKKYTDQSNLDLIFLLAPTSNDERIKMISRKARGFIYYISMTGVTGSTLSGGQYIEEDIQRIKKYTKLPIAIGFGISNPEQAKAMGKFAEGVVVGSAIVRLIEEHGDSPQLLQKVGDFVASLKQALK